MNNLKNPRLSSNARTLRRNMTPQERHLWYDYLRELPFMVHRQKVLGPYIVAFYIAAAKIVIEVDGSQHFEASGQERDRVRDGWLQEQGIRVLRFSNYEINRCFYGVCESIELAIQTVMNGQES